MLTKHKIYITRKIQVIQCRCFRKYFLKWGQLVRNNKMESLGGGFASNAIHGLISKNSALTFLISYCTTWARISLIFYVLGHSVRSS